MSDIVIRLRPDGPLVIHGSVRLVDEAGQEITPPPSDKPNLALCRCGQSAIKPFCDGSHKASGFRSSPTS